MDTIKIKGNIEVTKQELEEALKEFDKYEVRHIGLDEQSELNFYLEE